VFVHIVSAKLAAKASSLSFLLVAVGMVSCAAAEHSVRKNTSMMSASIVSAAEPVNPKSSQQQRRTWAEKAR
jgi:hypothetical protein